MEFSFGNRSYMHSSASHFSYVADLLTLHLGSYGSAVEQIEVTAFLRSVLPPYPSYREQCDRFHEYLTKLPIIRFCRKLKKIEIEFVSERFSEDDDVASKISAANCLAAAEEIQAVIPLMRRRIGPNDDFDLDRFLDDATVVLNTRMDSLEQWEDVRRQALEQVQLRQASMSPWDLLEIDWSKYHPQARAILDDPFFWETADDLAPHGNDTGVDLLEDFRRWNKRHGSVSPQLFLERLMSEWEIQPIDWYVTDELAVRTIFHDQSIEMNVCNEAAIALAFAVLKLRGVCPPETAQMALAALARTTICVEHSDLKPEIKAEWAAAIAKMRGKLAVEQRETPPTV